MLAATLAADVFESHLQSESPSELPIQQIQIGSATGVTWFNQRRERTPDLEIGPQVFNNGEPQRNRRRECMIQFCPLIFAMVAVQALFFFFFFVRIFARS